MVDWFEQERPWGDHVNVDPSGSYVPDRHGEEPAE